MLETKHHGAYSVQNQTQHMYKHVPEIITAWRGFFKDIVTNLKWVERYISLLERLWQKYHWLVSWNKNNFFLIALEAGKSKLKVLDNFLSGESSLYL